MENRLTPAVVSTWFDDAEVVELNDEQLILYTASPFRKEIIQRRCTEYIKDAMKEIFNTEITLVVFGPEELAEYKARGKANTVMDFNPQFTFEKFVVGSSNRFARSAAIAVANNPGQVYNPLFIYGPAGTGKTHLLYAIANERRRQHPDFIIVYIKGDQFTNELIAALQSGKNVEFRSKYREADLFLLCLGIFGVMLAFLLQRSAGTYEQLDSLYKRTRDDSTELHLLLTEKNHALLEKQDYEIYAATLRERNRIAREIHDNVGHVLSRSILMTAACKTINKNDSLDPLLGNLEESLNGAMNSIRSSVHDLHDDAIDLEDAIKGLVKDFTFCPVNLTYDMSRQIPREVKYSLISITKEGLSNVMRHSNADSVDILLREHPALYQLCIEDNGTPENGIPDIQTGSDSNKAKNISGDMGLSNIRDRAKTLGGTVQITQENGFRIFVTIPKSVSN